MSQQPPPTKAAGDVWRSADYNQIIAVLNSIVHNVVTKTGAYVGTEQDFAVLADATGSAFDVTLPAASLKGKMLLIVKIDSSGNAVGIPAGAGDTIEGAGPLSLAAQWNKALLVADGVHTWFRLV